MEGVGWIGAIIIGGVAGWLAERFMKSNMGLLMNILLGIVGAVVASFLLGLIGWMIVRKCTFDGVRRWEDRVNASPDRFEKKTSRGARFSFL